MRETLRERWPLCPRADVLPMPEPMPRPTRLRFSEDFFGARMLDRFMILILSISGNQFIAEGIALTLSLRRFPPSAAPSPPSRGSRECRDARGPGTAA